MKNAVGFSPSRWGLLCIANLDSRPGAVIKFQSALLEKGGSEASDRVPKQRLD